jgi:hypothetical protein
MVEADRGHFPVFSELPCSSVFQRWYGEISMFILWGRKRGDEVLEEGFINCPACRTRQPAAVVKYVKSWHLYFIPINKYEGPERVRCKNCGGYFANDEGVAFGRHEQMPDWNCFKCNKAIPYSRVDCPHCGFRFTGY